MSNMSYCRFENTCEDLADCVNALQEAIEEHDGNLYVNMYEFNKVAKMKELCEQFIELYEDVTVKHDYEETDNED